MEAYTPITPLEAGVEMFSKGDPAPLFPPGTFTSISEETYNRLSQAISEATQIWEEEFADDHTDFDEDESSEFEEDSFEYTFSESNEGRRSQTTISTYEEVQTPHSTRRSEFNLSIDTSRSMEGPVGPQLFRTSSASTDFDFDHALQLSPLFPKKEPPRAHTASQGPPTGSTLKGFPSNALALRSGDADDGPRSWPAGRVALWMSQCGIDVDICDRFENNDITGAVLMDMAFEDLKELEIRSFGKRHQLWNHICELRGGSGGISPVPTPFQDTSSLGSRRPARRDECEEDGVTPITPGTRRRKVRRARNPLETPITPAESVSIVAIEQLMPKPHKCARGDKCSKWKKQQKLLKRIAEEQGWPVSPEHGGHIMFTGDPGNASSARNLVPQMNNQLQSTSPAIPSFVASSDLLGPGEQPDFPPSLQEDLVQQLASRDPQENVRHFLTFQHVEPPQPYPITPIESPKLEMFPPMPTLVPAQMGPVRPNPQSLPRLSIPRAASAQPQLPTQSTVPLPVQQFSVPDPALDTFSPCRTAAASPAVGPIYRFGTPASEMDVPIASAFPVSPDTRDMSRSVPPNMQFRDPVMRTTSAMTYRRGPSLQLPTLGEDEVFSPARNVPRGSHQQQQQRASSGSSESSPERNDISSSTARGASSSSAASCTTATAKPAARGSSSSSSAAAGSPVNHAGWMKKRRTRLLRHEWADHHFRLTGTQLAMHANSLPSSSPLDTLNIDEYAVACSSLASSNKLAARFRALSLVGGGRDKGLDPAAFAFQLVPAGRPEKQASQSQSQQQREDGGGGGGGGEERRRLIKATMGGKTHHFAVRTRDERIDWMRELMLAKALRERKDGFDVRVVGADSQTP